MTRPILVPLDGSQFSERAIPTAIGVARRNQARVELVLVHELFVPPPEGPREMMFVSPIMDSEWRSRQGAYMRDLVARLQKTTSVPITGNVMDGPVVPGLIEHVQSSDAQLVVMATHGESSAGRLWLASVTRAITHQSPVPVLLVKPGASGFEPQRERYAKVLVPVDGSLLSETAIEHAVMVAGTTGVQFILLRVVTPVEEWELGAGAWASSDDLAMTEAETYIDHHLRQLKLRGIDAVGETVRARRSAPAILTAARSHEVDLVAVTTHSRGAASRLFRRSVADALARNVSTAALVARKYAAVPGAAEPVEHEEAVAV
ncbi:MAG TPA: universal stress protein [Gemmatimonadaceae bacterium]|nr:universal stress protein [Gemmatimonadaceae bacterium]